MFQFIFNNNVIQFDKNIIYEHNMIFETLKNQPTVIV